jgi:hypothetical protein
MEWLRWFLFTLAKTVLTAPRTLCDGAADLLGAAGALIEAEAELFHAVVDDNAPIALVTTTLLIAASIVALRWTRHRSPDL